MRNFGGCNSHKESLSDLGGRNSEATTSDPWKPARSPSEVRPARPYDAASRYAVYRQRTVRRGEGTQIRPAPGEEAGAAAWVSACRGSFDGPSPAGGGGGSSRRSTAMGQRREHRRRSHGLGPPATLKNYNEN